MSEAKGEQAGGGQAAGTEPSGYKGDSSATAGTGKTDLQSSTPENRDGHINPSAPEDSNATPGTTGVK